VRILVVEDDHELRGSVVRRLRKDGFAVDEASDVADAIHAASVSDYDCFVLDRVLPGGDALELLSGLRGDAPSTPVLFMTCRDTVEERVAGFEAGGDDYLVKPFAMDELLARVRSLCRRHRRSVRAPVVRLGDLELDSPRREVRRRGVLLPLTAKEFAILELLAETPGVVVSRSHIIEHCWDDHADPLSNVVDVHVASVRRKLGVPPLIRTVRGAGFILDASRP
jgi:DNA-binding response OmpR family regulator